METSSTSTDQARSGNPVDDIANLLGAEMGGDDTQPEVADETLEQYEDSPEYEAGEAETDDSQDDESEAASVEDEDNLASLLGLSEDQIVSNDDGFKVKVKVNGETSEVDLAELVKGYQFNSSNNQKAQALAAERKQFEEAQVEYQGRIEQQVQQAEGLTMMMQKQLMDDFEKINWQELRQYDPGEYAAKQADYQQRQQQIQRATAYMQQYREQMRQQGEAKHQQERAKHLQSQWDVMLNNNPQWRDDNVFETEMGELRDFVNKQYGFTEQDMAHVSDARLIELIKDARAFRAGKSVAAKKTPPKLQRAKNGQFVANKQTRRQKLVEAAKRAKGANSRELQTAAITDLLMNGG